MDSHNDINNVDVTAARIESDMIDASKADWGSTPKQVKGGTFAPADMPLIKNALFYYKDMLVKSEESERNVSEELAKVANLLHRLGRIA